ncbi:MAG: hypothetical protein R3A78_12065 [Polyangiales bacterium]|nr:hypothetical protein [Myxococcales bacterium]
MERNRVIASLFVAASLAFGVAGCADEIDAAIDCNDICSKYAECFDSDYDEEACFDRCDDKANDNEDFDHKVDVCSACIDGQSCVESGFMCAADCAGIVP